MATTRKPEKIRSVEVKRLFNRFDHKIEFLDDNDIVILTAPNGHGKTVMLRIVHALFSRRLYFFWKLTFQEIVVTFATGKKIYVYRDQENLFSERTVESSSAVTIKSKGFGADDQQHTPSPSIQSTALRHLERNLPIDRIDSNTWIDMVSERVMSTAEVVELYADRLPEKLVGSFKLPDWLGAILSSISTHLVETQRLLSIDEEYDSRAPSYRRSTPPTSSVVEKDSKDLASKISRVLQEYANESQKLDQSFPRRIIADRGIQVDDEEVIRRRLEELNAKRDQLVAAGLIGSTLNAPIEPSEKFSDEQVRKILSIYINDTEQKLSVFDELYDKIRLFKQILDEHFSFKSIAIDPTHGIRAIDDDDGSEIPLSELSSGEQHELVLIYELLFTVEEGSLILIDEPELSLHVAWQKRFISDLQKIQSLKSLEVVIATHSPQIINDSWDLVQELSA